MDPTLWAAFAAASVALLAIPGPTILLVCSYALSVGKRAAAATAVGVALGDLVAMTASLAGLGALLAASAFWFDVLKYLGAAYLIYLGVVLYLRVGLARSAPAAEEAAGDDDDAATASSAPWRIGAHAFAVTATNPKSILFFVAFTPQFLDAGAPLLPQMAVMVATFVILATLNALIYAALAERLGRRLRTPRARLWTSRLGGGALVAMGVLAALSRRPAG